MTVRGRGTLLLRYKPLESLDDLQLLLLAACRADACKVSLLEKTFSFPRAALMRELEQLEAFGLAQNGQNDSWSCSSRGKMIAAVWERFQGRGPLPVKVASPEWPLGAGCYSVPDEVETESDIGFVEHEGTRLDERGALQIVTETTSGNNSERQQRRFRAAVGVLVFSWLCQQPEPIRTAARCEPASFLCDVTEWELLSSAKAPVPKPPSPQPPDRSTSPDGLLDKLYHWFFG